MTQAEADVRVIKADVQAIKDDVAIVKEVQSNQSSQLRALQADVNGLKNSFRGQQREMHRLAVLFEDLDNRFAALAETP